MIFSQEFTILYETLPKILIATICGLIVGYEREKKNKVAGLRTIVLISIGTCIFTICSIITASFFNSDPSRIISTIVTGIGFLGGGVIIKQEDKLVGVTTAAFIWIIAGIGILCGIGLILTPILITLVVVLMSWYFESIEKNIHDK
jgi:putative Mg2+ transporter-C (MgtC) family protein